MQCSCRTYLSQYGYLRVAKCHVPDRPPIETVRENLLRRAVVQAVIDGRYLERDAARFRIGVEGLGEVFSYNLVLVLCCVGKGGGVYLPRWSV
jgi:hypothetical protein